MYIGKYGEKCREQRAESREQRAESSGRCPPEGGEKTILQVVWSTDLYLALHHRERHHKQGSEFGRQVAGDAHQEDIVI